MLFLIIGPDTYRAHLKLTELKEKFRREVDPTGLNLHTVNGLKVNPEDLSHYLETTSLLARRRFVVFQNLFANKNKKVFQALQPRLEKLKTEGNIIIFFEDSLPKTKIAPLEWLRQYGHVQFFEYLSKPELSRWAINEFKKKKRAITSDALVYLLDITGNDLWALSREIEKIDAYLDFEILVDRTVIEMMAGNVVNDDVFMLVDAVVRGNLKVGAPLLIEQLSRGLAPELLVSLLESQLRVLILLATSGSQALSGIHPYVIKKLTPLSRQVSSEVIENIYADLASVDVELKTGTEDVKTVLLNFLARRASATASLI